jgi:hypothetical protein
MKVHSILINRVWVQKVILLLTLAIFCAMCNLQAQLPKKECDIRLDLTIGSIGNLTNDGKGTYYTGKDWIGVWFNPTRWPDQSFHICMSWPFTYFPGCDSATAPSPTGTRGSRTMLHRMTNPLPNGNGKPLGVFTGPGGGNDLAVSKPVTSTITQFTDMAIGSSLSPLSTEIRFCNSDCTEYFSLIFGEKSVWSYPENQNINGAGSTRPTITRTSATNWTMIFPSGTVGRLWNRTEGEFHKTPTSELYYYSGSLEFKLQ